MTDTFDVSLQTNLKNKKTNSGNIPSPLFVKHYVV